MTAKRQVLNSLLGERVTINLLDREETQIVGELIEIDELGACQKYSSHGNEYIEFCPMNNINTISYKVLDAK